MRKHTYMTVITQPAASNKRGIGAVRLAQSTGLAPAAFWDYLG